MSIGQNLHTCNKTALILSAIVLVVCVVYKEVLEARLKRKVPFPIPIDLIIVSLTPLVPSTYHCLLQVIAATCACTYLNLNDRYGVAVMGDIPTG